MVECESGWVGEHGEGVYLAVLERGSSYRACASCARVIEAWIRETGSQKVRLVEPVLAGTLSDGGELYIVPGAS